MATSTAQAIATVPVYDYQMAPGDPTSTNPKGLKGKKVKITLTYAQSQSASPVTFLSTDPVYVETDSNGFWQVNLVPNNKISPTGTLYTVEIEGNRSYLINVTDVAAPGIGWQSSAIAILPPVGGGAPGYTLPGGTQVLGNLTINGSEIVQGQNPRFDVSHPVYAGGALGNGVNDDAPAINAAGLAASNAGGGEVWIPPTATNVYGIKSAITLYSNVTYRCVSGTVIKWIGPAPLVDTFMFGTVAVLGAHLFRPAMYNLTLNAASLGHVIPLQLDSVWMGYFENLYLQNANGLAGQYAMKLLASVGNTFANNTAMNVFVGLKVDSCQRGIQFNGNQNGTGVTNNYFYGTHLLCTDAWCDFQQWCDSNYFYGFDFGVAINSTGTFRGLTFGDPVTDFGVHSERFNGGSIDTNAAGMAAAVGIVLNVCSAIRFEQLFSGIGNVGGQVTFESGTLFTTIAATGNYHIEWINQAAGPAANLTIIFEKSRRWITNPSDVNGLSILGASAGNVPTLQAQGTDANISVNIQGKGTGAVELAAQQFNWWEVLGSPTGSEMQVRPQGGDTNVNIQINSKGNGVIRVGANQFNWLDVQGATTGNAVQLIANGGDANIPLHVNSKGTGEVRLSAQRTNFLAVFGSNATQDVQVVPEGGDTNISVQLNAKGTGVIKFVANATNFIQAAGAATTLAPSLQAVGGDANIDLILASKGTGFVNAGVAGARLRLDSFGHLVSDSTGTPATSNLGANVTSVTPTGNDIRGKLVIVMAGALAANTRIATVTYAHAYASAPFPFLINQTSGAGLGIVNFYVAANAAGSFDLTADQALAAGTYECEYLVVG